MPRGGSPKPKTSPGRVKSTVREGEAIKLRLGGMSIPDIAVELGYKTRQGAHLAIKRALARIGSQDVVEYREINTARLESLFKKWWLEFEKDGLDTYEKLAVTDRLRGLISDMRALHGLDLAKIPGSTADDPLFIAPGNAPDVELTPEEAAILVRLDPALQTIIDEQGNFVGRNGQGESDD